MTQQEKQLLLKDLSARLSYGVKVIERSVIIQTLHSLENAGKTWYVNPLHEEHGNISPLSTPIEEVRPFLRPMKSMTEEEQEEYFGNRMTSWAQNEFGETHTEAVMQYRIDFLLEHHLDYRGLIEKGLALEAPEGMYDKEKTNYHTDNNDIKDDEELHYGHLLVSLDASVAYCPDCSTMIEVELGLDDKLETLPDGSKGLKVWCPECDNEFYAK